MCIFDEAGKFLARWMIEPKDKGGWRVVIDADKDKKILREKVMGPAEWKQLEERDLKIAKGIPQ